MNDMARIARRGLEVLPRAPRPLFVASAAWTALNAMTPWLDLGPLLLGPALLGLFHVTLKALREEEAHWQDAFIFVREPTTSLVAGIVFALPFAAWTQFNAIGQSIKVSMFGNPNASVPGVPIVVTLFVLVFFAVYIFVFARLADVGGGLVDAIIFAHRMAEQPGRPDSRVSGFGRQIIYCSVVFITLFIVGWSWRFDHLAPFLFSALLAPPAVGILAAWHDERLAEMSGERAEPAAGDAMAGED